LRWQRCGRRAPGGSPPGRRFAGHHATGDDTA
jgi:hypothetical protein